MPLMRLRLTLGGVKAPNCSSRYCGGILSLWYLRYDRVDDRVSGEIAKPHLPGRLPTARYLVEHPLHLGSEYFSRYMDRLVDLVYVVWVRHLSHRLP